MKSTAPQHKEGAPKRLNVVVITLSTSKYSSQKKGEVVEDRSGDVIERLVKEAGHKVVERMLLPDDKRLIRGAFKRLLNSPNVNLIISTGGTGVSNTDVTVESVKGLLEKELPGFGELFRMLSYRRIGSPALMSRALSGISNGKAVFCLPGSPYSIEVAMKKLILPEAPHIIRHSQGG